MRTVNRPPRARIVSRPGLLALRTSDGRVPRIVIVDPGEARENARARLIDDARAMGFVIDETPGWKSAVFKPAHLAMIGGSASALVLAIALLARPASVPAPAPADSPPAVRTIATQTPVPQLVETVPPPRPPASASPQDPTGLSAPVPPAPIVPAPELPMILPAPFDPGPDWPSFIPYSDRFPSGGPPRPSQEPAGSPAIVATPVVQPSLPTGSTPAGAIPLVLATPRFGQIVGNRAGAFTYFTIPNPGSGSTGTLALTFDPSDPVTSLAVGMNLWQDGRLLAAANGSGAMPGQNQLPFTSSGADPILVQVANYAPGAAISFQVVLTDLNAAAPAPAVATPTVASSAQAPLPLTPSGDGLLPGNRAGSFVYYWLPSPGAGQVQALNLDFTPGGADVGRGVFVAVYQDGQVLARGQASGGEAPGCLTVRFALPSASPVLVQLANYNPSATIHYRLRRV